VPDEGIEALQLRMKQLEENLSQALNKIDQLEAKGHRGVPQSSAADFSQSTMIMASSLQEPDEVLDFVDSASRPLDLSPLHEALPV
jgi:hypothetical protein